jgi:transaldolase
MKFFLDSAITDEIKYALEMVGIDGVTTNPRHVQASGKPFMGVIREIADIFKGTDLPVSVEVNPHHDDWREMVAEGKKLAAISPNFVIKLPATEAGYRALRAFYVENIRVNLTLVFSGSQALQAMRLGATFVSPFIGWKEEVGEESVRFIQEVVMMRDNYDFDTQIIVSAVRNGRQIVEAATAGADIVTCGLAVYKGMIQHPWTDEGLKRFCSFWDKTPYE